MGVHSPGPAARSAVSCSVGSHFGRYVCSMPPRHRVRLHRQWVASYAGSSSSSVAGPTWMRA